ncbi:oleate hydratase [Penicillium lividum]|nr:oleate hydratase [Penicillium lividum]
MSGPDQDQQHHKDLHVWILGSSIGSLATAVFLIRDAEIPAPQIHLVESRGAPEDGLPTTGDAASGYDHHSSGLPLVCDTYTEYLLSRVPSIAYPEQTALDNLNSSKDVSATRLFFQGDNHLKAVDPSNSNIGWKVWMSLMTVVLKSEKSLDRKVIHDCFKAKFFSSEFWIVWSSTPPDRYTCDPQEDIILPITHLLQKEGINFHFDVTVTDIVMVQEQDSRRISAFKWMEDEKEILVNVVKHDIVIATLGSSVSGSTSGTNTQPPSLELLKAEDRLDANWSLWLAFGSSLGDPYNFCTRVDSSRVETFTTTFQGPDCFTVIISSNQ